METLKFINSKKWWENLETPVKDEIIHSLYITLQSSLKSNDEIKNLKETLMNENKRISDEYQNAVTNLTSSLEFEHEKNIYKLQKDLEEKNILLQQRDDKFIDKFDEIKNMITMRNYTSTQKGIEGETMVERIVYENYDDVNLEDTRSQKNNGDYILTMKNVKILFEIKNVNQNSLSTNIKLFRQQITNDLFLSNIKVGILISIQNVTFQKEQYLSYEFLENPEGEKVCVIYCSNVKEQSFLLIASIKLARLLSKFILDNTTNINNDGLIKMLKIHIPVMNNMLKKIKEDTVLLDKLQISNNESRRMIQNFINDTLKITDINLDPVKDNETILKEIVILYKKISEETDGNITSTLLQKHCLIHGFQKDVIKTLGGFSFIKKQIRKKE